MWAYLLRGITTELTDGRLHNLCAVDMANNRTNIQLFLHQLTLSHHAGSAIENAAKHLTEPPTKGAIAFLFDLIGHIERDEVSTDKATIDYRRADASMKILC